MLGALRFIIIALSIISASVWSSTSGLPNPKERIDFWRNNYNELTPDMDRRVPLVRNIFNRVLRVAGNRHGIIPRLHILDQDPMNISLPISIPDGWIILSKRVIDLCFNNGDNGEDKLAFILSHEVAHLLDDDFWHMSFFYAIERLKNTEQQNSSTLTEVVNIVNQTNKIAAKELRADEKGILIAAMAGYDVGSIVNNESKQNFFQEWEQLLQISRLNQYLDKALHPTPEQRKAAVMARLKVVAEHAELFELGLLFYQTGDYPLSIRAFDEFLRYFPSKEVYHNLGVNNHQLAMNYAAKTKLFKNQLSYKLPVEIDVYNRAAKGVFRGQREDAQRFKDYIKKAIQYYKMSLEQDPEYLSAQINLGAAYLLNKEPYKAIAILSDAYALNKKDVPTMNALAVAYDASENGTKAINLLQDAIRQNKSYADSYYNLGIMYWRKNEVNQARIMWNQYLEQDAQSEWAQRVAALLNIKPKHEHHSGLSALDEQEQLMGLTIGHYLEEVPQDWAVRDVSEYRFLEASHKVTKFDNGLTAVAEGGEIFAIQAAGRYRGHSKLGVSIGDKRAKIIAQYGQPSIEYNLGNSDGLVYRQRGITFQVRNEKVVSWVIY